MSIYKISIYVREHEHEYEYEYEHGNENGDTILVVIEMSSHNCRKWLVLNDICITTQVMIEIRSHYFRDDPIHNKMMLYKFYV
jgi:hypothetical protein